MYTLEQVETAILEYFNDGMDEGERVDSYDGELLVDGAAEDVLTVGLGVADAKDRVEWYNAVYLDSDDILNLANLDFSVVECERCGEKQRFGNPDDWGDFQGVNQDEMLEVTIEPLGVNALLCGDCLSELKVFVYRY